MKYLQSEIQEHVSSSSSLLGIRTDGKGDIVASSPPLITQFFAVVLASPTTLSLPKRPVLGSMK